MAVKGWGTHGEGAKEKIWEAASWAVTDTVDKIMWKLHVIAGVLGGTRESDISTTTISSHSNQYKHRPLISCIILVRKYINGTKILSCVLKIFKKNDWN